MNSSGELERLLSGTNVPKHVGVGGRFVIFQGGKQVLLSFLLICRVGDTCKKQGAFRTVHPALWCVFVVLAAAG